MDVMSLTLPQEGWGVVHGRDKQVVARVKDGEYVVITPATNDDRLVALVSELDAAGKLSWEAKKEKRWDNSERLVYQTTFPDGRILELESEFNRDTLESADFLRIPVEGARMSSIHIYHPQKTISSLMDRVTVRLGGQERIYISFPNPLGPEWVERRKQEIASTIAVLEAISR